MARDSPLAAGVFQFLGVPQLRGVLRASLGDNGQTPPCLRRPGVADEEHGTIAELRALRLTDVRMQRAAGLPGLAAVIAVDNTRSPGSAVVHWNDQPAGVRAAHQREARAGTWNNEPAAILDLPTEELGHSLRFAPGPAIVVTIGDILTRGVAVPAAHEDPGPAGTGVDHRAGVVDRMPTGIPDHDLRAPGLAAIFAATHNRIDVADVRPADAASLGKSEDRSLLRDRQGGNAIADRLAVDRPL